MRSDDSLPGTAMVMLRPTGLRQPTSGRCGRGGDDKGGQIPGLRNAIEPLNRIIRIRADAAGGFEDSACAPDHSVAFLHAFCRPDANPPEGDLRWADSSLYVLGARVQSTKRAIDGG